MIAVLRRNSVCIVASVLFFMSGVHVPAQCNPSSPGDAAVHSLYAQKKWSEVVAAASHLPSRAPDVNFELGMALAHLQQWSAADVALREGRDQCPAQKRFPIELAGVAFQQKKYPQAAAWIEKGLRLDPRDEYANDFAGTVFLLMGNLDAALKFWNRLHRPEIGDLQLDPGLRVRRLLLERAFAFSPQAQMRRHDLLSSEARLERMGIFPGFSIHLNARPDGRFDAQFHTMERTGFGDGWLQSVVSVFSGLPYETVYPSYFNIGHSATNLDSLFRWDAQKRRAWISLAGPIHYLPQWRWKLAIDGRDENWAIRNSFEGSAPVLASFKLKREVTSATVTSIRSGTLQWTSGVELSHRTYGDVVSGSVLTPDLISHGFELKHLAAVNAQLLDLPEHRLVITTAGTSEFTRLWSTPARLFEKAQGSAELHWFPQAQGEKYEFSQRVRAGAIVGSPPIDELWLIGVERDTDLWLRGHVGTRDGRKGSSPLADRYFLANTDLYRNLWGNGLISIKAGPLFDVARAAAPAGGLAPRQWLFDAGIEVKLSVLGTGVVLTYGRDLRNGNNAFYGSVMQR